MNQEPGIDEVPIQAKPENLVWQHEIRVVASYEHHGSHEIVGVGPRDQQVPCADALMGARAGASRSHKTAHPDH